MDRPGETMQADDSAPAPREQRVTVHAAAQDPWRPPKDALASKRGARSSLKRPPCAGARASPTPEADDLLSLVPRALSYGLLGVRVHGPVVLIVLDTGQWAQLGRPRERTEPNDVCSVPDQPGTRAQRRLRRPRPGLLPAAGADRAESGAGPAAA